MSENRRKTAKFLRSDVSVPVVQVILCAAILLAAWLIRSIGGEIYEEVREAFRYAVTDSVAVESEDEISAPTGAAFVKILYA